MPFSPMADSFRCCSTSYTATAVEASRWRRIPAAQRKRVIRLSNSRLDTNRSQTEDFTESERLQLLKSSVDDLVQLVKEQQGLMQEQQKTVEKLKAEIAGAPNSNARRPAASSWTLRPSSIQEKSVRPFDSQRIGIGDRRMLGLFDSRFHSTSLGATPKDFRVLPDRIFLVRHAESEGNIDGNAYTTTPDSQVKLTDRGHIQAQNAGLAMRKHIEDRGGGRDYKLFFYTSPYRRSLQTYESISACFSSANIRGVQEEVQLREQDFGNFQDANGKLHEKAERLRFGRFFYRFPNGESGADVYDRITIFEDHMIRDINAGRFADQTNLVLVTHGLALRIFLMRWFHWNLDQYLEVHNPPNAEPLVLERVTTDAESRPSGAVAWKHTKALYRLTPESMDMLRGCTSDMCSTAIMPRYQDDASMMSMSSMS